MKWSHWAMVIFYLMCVFEACFVLYNLIYYQFGIVIVDDLLIAYFRLIERWRTKMKGRRWKEVGL